MTRSEGREAGPGVRCRLRLILGMRVLDRLERDPAAVGTSIPSIRSVAFSSGAHRNTVAAVMSDLAGFGLVRCAVGSGCTVSCPPSAHDLAHPLFCAEPEAACLLTSALGRPVSEGATPPARSLVLHPLDLPPPSGMQCIPLAPRGTTLCALHALRPGSMVVILSRSPAVRRLMANSIRAIHGRRVSVMSGDFPELDPRLIRSPLFGRSTVVFHDPGSPVDGLTAASCPLLVVPPKAVDTG